MSHRQRVDRRTFLGALAAAGATGLFSSACAQPAAQADRPLKLGFDNFSVRGFNWKAPQLIDYAQTLNVDVLLMSDLDVYESLEADYLQQGATAGRSGGD